MVDIDPDEDYREDDDDYYDYSTDETEEDKIHKNDGLYMEESTNMITQLYSKNIIKSYAFFVITIIIMRISSNHNFPFFCISILPKTIYASCVLDLSRLFGRLS